MSVYVDELRPRIPNAHWRYKESCHMFADAVEELHLMARNLGLRRGWFQDHDRWPHYDLTRNKRVRAIQLGALQVSAKQYIKRKREVG